jgi:hypothetical protein
MPFPVIRAFGVLKKCAADYNCTTGAMDRDVADAIKEAADGVIAGKLDEHFPLWVANSFARPIASGASSPRPQLLPVLSAALVYPRRISFQSAKEAIALCGQISKKLASAKCQAKSKSVLQEIASAWRCMME